MLPITDLNEIAQKSPRHQYAHKVMEKMRSKGIKPTHLRGYIPKISIDRFMRYEAPFATIIKIDDILDRIKQ